MEPWRGYLVIYLWRNVEKQQLKYKWISSPVGKLKIIVDDTHLRAILWEQERLNRVNLDEMKEDSKDILILKVEMHLREYFEGKRSSFQLPMYAQGTSFQENVWELLNKIPYGSTCSYGEIAEKLDNPKAVRAVGGAVGRNPISIIIPCHRVIGSDGSLTGFAGGLDRKKILLEIEGLYTVVRFNFGRHHQPKAQSKC